MTRENICCEKSEHFLLPTSECGAEEEEEEAEKQRDLNQNQNKTKGESKNGADRKHTRYI